MTWSWTIPLAPAPGALIESPPLEPGLARAVVPTFRDWPEARQTVESLLACRPRPAEIVLVDDNGEGDPPAWTRRLPIALVSYAGNRGPAYARNAGARLCTGRPITWLYLTDSACTRASDFFAVLGDFSRRSPGSVVAIAGPVHGAAISPALTPVNWYMTEEGILCPPRDLWGPQAIVTANAAVSRAAFRAAGGFDESFRLAGGEDLDLGMKLRGLGTIAWCDAAVVRHEFPESIDDLTGRFRRYGRGSAQLARKWALPSLRGGAVVAGTPELQYLADAHAAAAQAGYDLECRFQAALSGAASAKPGTRSNAEGRTRR